MQPPLYHGSPERLAVLNPNNQLIARDTRANVVFATPSEVYAHAYAFKTRSSFTHGNVGDWYFAVVSHEAGDDWEARLPRMERGPGGYIYKINPPHTFRLNSLRQSQDEWISEEPVTVTPTERRFVTTEDCMRAGVQIFAVADTEKYSWRFPMWWEPIQIIGQGIQDNGLTWINRERGVNPLPLPTFRSSLLITPPFKELGC